MLIDCSYFTVGPRHIQNCTLGKVPNPNAEEVTATIKAYIAKYQQPFLTRAVGAPVAGAIISYLKLIEIEPDTEPQADLDMVIEQLREPFAEYVFFHILRDSNTQATMTGLVRLKCDNDYVAPIRRQVNTWNDMVDMIAGFAEWCKSSNCTMPGISTDPHLLTKINVLNL